jgi:hypothetical protein
VADAAAMQRASPFAFAMRAKTQRMRRIAAGGEMVEEEFVPALGAICHAPWTNRIGGAGRGLEGSLEMTSSFGLRAAGSAAVVRRTNIDASSGDPDASIAGFVSIAFHWETKSRAFFTPSRNRPAEAAQAA